MAEIEIKSPKDRLKILIYGYEGYLTPESRLKTCKIYENFIHEKVLLMYDFFSKKYDESAHQVNQVRLLGPLADTLKLFSECKEKLNYQLPLLKYFLEEYKLDSLKTEIFYQNDFEILKNISSIVDKITSLNFSSEEIINQLNHSVSNLKTSIFKRIDTIIFLNSELKEKADESAKCKMISGYIDKSNVFYEMAEFLENQMHYCEAIEFYDASIRNDVENKAAVQGLARCNNRVKLYADFQKANRFSVQGKYAQAVELYNQILSKAPDLETVKLLRDKVNKLELKNA